MEITTSTMKGYINSENPAERNPKLGFSEVLPQSDTTLTRTETLLADGKRMKHARKGLTLFLNTGKNNNEDFVNSFNLKEQRSLLLVPGEVVPKQGSIAR